MAGIYIHIPFCKQRCNYCDFYKETTLQYTTQFTEALQSELHSRSVYLNSASVGTIYFGGGTPSVLSQKEFQAIFSTIFQYFNVKENAEITIEANPDDLTPSYLAQLSILPFNRISMGIQSFHDDELKAVNRRHTAHQAIQAVKDARNAGFNNISIDLIYGLPGQTMEKWQHNLEQAFILQPEHISAYGLTYEEGTGLWKQRDKGLVIETPDEVMLQMYRYMLQQMSIKGYDAYEISNFALPGFRSQHNSSYWDMTPYLGVGPSAHSYNGTSRQWNISNLQHYINAIELSMPAFEKEELSKDDSYNDYVMVRLRTREGIHLSDVTEKFGRSYHEYILQQAVDYLQTAHLILDNGRLCMSIQGIEISNAIISHLMKTG